MLTPTRPRRLPTHLRRRARATPPPAETAPTPWRPGHYDGPTSTDGKIRLARFLATGIIAPIYRHNPGACLSLIMKAQALDVPVDTAKEGVWWNPAIGKGTIHAQLMAGLLHRAGYTFKVTEESDQRVAMTFYQTVDGRKRRLGDVEWTILEAIGACLTWRDQWRHHPTDMLWARCLMRGARRYAQRVGTGMAYTMEELADMSGPGVAGEIHDTVQQIITEATAPGVSSDWIRNDLVKLAAKWGLLDADTGDGTTLAVLLGLLWGQARAREADAAQAARPTPAPAPVEPAGTGVLPCGCPAEQVLRTGQHVEGVHHAES